MHCAAGTEVGGAGGYPHVSASLPTQECCTERESISINLVLSYSSATTGSSAHLAHSSKDVTSPKLVRNQRNISYSIDESVKEWNTLQNDRQA